MIRRRRSVCLSSICGVLLAATSDPEAAESLISTAQVDFIDDIPPDSHLDDEVNVPLLEWPSNRVLTQLDHTHQPTFYDHQIGRRGLHPRNTPFAYGPSDEDPSRQTTWEPFDQTPTPPRQPGHHGRDLLGDDAPFDPLSDPLGPPAYRTPGRVHQGPFRRGPPEPRAPLVDGIFGPAPRGPLDDGSFGRGIGGGLPDRPFGRGARGPLGDDTFGRGTGGAVDDRPLGRGARVSPPDDGSFGRGPFGRGARGPPDDGSFGRGVVADGHFGRGTGEGLDDRPFGRGARGPPDDGNFGRGVVVDGHFGRGTGEGLDDRPFGRGARGPLDDGSLGRGTGGAVADGRAPRWPVDRGRLGVDHATGEASGGRPPGATTDGEIERTKQHRKKYDPIIESNRPRVIATTPPKKVEPPKTTFAEPYLDK